MKRKVLTTVELSNVLREIGEREPETPYRWAYLTASSICRTHHRTRAIEKLESLGSTSVLYASVYRKAAKVLVENLPEY